MQSAVAQLDGIVAPEIILPSQFFSAASIVTERPEKRLMLAVLQDAVATLIKHAGSAGRGPRRLVREAEQWIYAHNADWPYSFENICAALNLDPGALRQGLRRIAATRTRPARVLALPIARHVVGERHRVSVPRPHHRAQPTAGDT